MSIPNPLRVWFLCSEADPFVKVGGLGDVGGSLPEAIRRLEYYQPPEEGAQAIPAKVDIRLVIPLHPGIQEHDYSLEKCASLQVPHTNGPIQAEVFTTLNNQAPVYFIDGEPLRAATSIYSSDGGLDGHKYTFFSLAAMELARQLDWRPHILHANDWHTAPAVYWLWRQRAQDEFYRQTASLLTVHNLPFMGVGAEFPLTCFYLPPAKNSALPEWAQQLPLPLGLMAADQIVAVSPTYAQEMLTPEYGAGLEGFLRGRGEALTGILNGLDLQRWNPADDPFLSVCYTQDSLDLRTANKIALLHELGFTTSPSAQEHLQAPLFAMVSRMDYQKGTDLALEAFNQLARQAAYPQQPWRAVLLGTGLPELEQAARRVEERFPNRIRAALRFDAGLSHRLYASADVLLMPSRYEPCGLSQMIAMRYGCVPAARTTGGLKDTIVDVAVHPEEGTGFLFAEPTAEALQTILEKILLGFPEQEQWRALQRRGMQQDFSWSRSARAYQALYYSLTQQKEVEK